MLSQPMTSSPPDCSSPTSYETLDGFEMTFPETTSDRRKELLAMRKQLQSE